MPRLVVRWTGSSDYPCTIPAYLTRGSVQNPRTLRYSTRWFFENCPPSGGSPFFSEEQAWKAYDESGQGFRKYVTLEPLPETRQGTPPAPARAAAPRTPAPLDDSPPW